jgi:hypothetical protein
MAVQHEVHEGPVLLRFEVVPELAVALCRLDAPTVRGHDALPPLGDARPEVRVVARAPEQLEVDGESQSGRLRRPRARPSRAVLDPQLRHARAVAHGELDEQG